MDKQKPFIHSIKRVSGTDGVKPKVSLWKEGRKLDLQALSLGRISTLHPKKKEGLGGKISPPSHKSMLSNDQYDGTLSFKNLWISPYGVEKILDVRIEQQINQHGKFYFKGILSDQQKDRYIEEVTEGSGITLNMDDGSGSECALFHGVVSDIRITAVQMVYYIEVHALSYSSLLDITKRSRSFQNKKMSYEKLIQQVAAEYKGACVLDVASDGVATNQFIMQHLETDWEFLKRLASHFNTSLVCDPRYDKPVCYFGVPEKNPLELHCFNYSVKKDIQKFKRLSASGVKGLYDSDFIYYELETEQIVNFGNQVNFQNRVWHVIAMTSVIDKGVFVTRCIVTTKRGLSQPYQFHDSIGGGSFNGRILEIQNDQVKVHLDVDAKQDLATACFFPYSTIYSSEDGSGWYCMPEIGDSVRIYFPDGEDNHAYAISSVHEQVKPSMEQQTNPAMGQAGEIAGSGGGAGGYSGQRDDPNVKSLRNKSGKEIRLTPEGVYIIVDGTTITLTDEEGVSIVSDNNISFQSDKSIILSAEENVNILGTTGVDLKCSDTASIMMKENVEIIGQEVKSN